MFFESEFKKIGEVPVDNIVSALDGVPEEWWSVNQKRQQQFSVHKRTQTISFLADEDFRHTNPTRHAFLDDFEAVLAPVMREVSAYYNESEVGRRLRKKRRGAGYFIRMIMTRLEAGGEIPKHTDTGMSLSCCHRVHLPIITNDQIMFSVGGVTRALKQGELWEINNRLPHAVKNASDEARVHIIMDYVLPGEKVKDPGGEKLLC